MRQPDTAPTRRAIVANAGLLATIAAVGAVGAPCAIAEAKPITSLLALGAELDACHTAYWAFDRADRFNENPHYERHWELREQIDAIPASSYRELHVKARAARYALDNDPDAECEGLGSFVGLSLSLIADLFRLQGAA